jgi:hypothetical protein
MHPYPTARPIVPPFAQQRILFFALPLGVVAMAGVISVLANDPGPTLPGTPPPAQLPPDDLLGAYVWPVAAALAAAAFAVRRYLHGKADAAEGEARRLFRFRATLVPLALLEGGALFGLVAWLIAKNEQPGLIAALVLLAAMLAIIPLQDRDEATR